MRGDGFSLARNLPHKNKIVDRVSENPYSRIFHAAISFQINPFHVNVPFLYPLKTSENQQVMAPNQLCKLLKIGRIIFSFLFFISQLQVQFSRSLLCKAVTSLLCQFQSFMSFHFFMSIFTHKCKG